MEEKKLHVHGKNDSVVDVELFKNAVKNCCCVLGYKLTFSPSRCRNLSIVQNGKAKMRNYKKKKH